MTLAMLRTDTVHRAQGGAALSFGIPGLGHAFLGEWPRSLWWGVLVPLLGNLVAAGLAYPRRLPAVIGTVIGSGPVTGPPVPRLLLVPGRPWVLAGKLALGLALPGGNAVTGRLMLATTTAIFVTFVIRVLAARSAARLAYRQYWTLRLRTLQQRLLAQLADRYERDLLDVPTELPSPNAPYDDLRTVDLLSVRELGQALGAVAPEAHRAGDDTLIRVVAASPALIPPAPSTPIPDEAMDLKQAAALLIPDTAAGAPSRGAASQHPPSTDTFTKHADPADTDSASTPDQPASHSSAAAASGTDAAAEPAVFKCPECGRRVTAEHGFCPWCATEFEDGTG